MRKITAIAALCACVSISVSAQTSVSRTYIKGGQDAWSNYIKEVFLNPSFEDGIVEYKNGKRYKSTLNYNRAVGAIQFIDEKGDTLALTDEESIRTVSIGQAVFYLNPVCMQQIAGNDKFVLAKHESLRIADKQKVGALGIPNSSGTIDSYDRSDSRNNDRIDVNEQLLLRKTSNFFIGNAERSFVPASKKNVLALFPASQKSIKTFIEDKKIDFNDGADLTALGEFLETL